MEKNGIIHCKLAAIILALMLALSYGAWAQADETLLIPGGQLAGIYVKADGLVYVGASDLGSKPSPARIAGLKSGDVIQRINGVRIYDAETLKQALSGGNKAIVEYVRNGETIKTSVTPERDPRDGVYRIGAWVRENAAGVGTITFINPKTGQYGALGHAISDPDTGIIVPISQGAIYESNLSGVIPGKTGVPGELSGDFIEKDNSPIGTIDKNSENGIYGTFIRANLENALYPAGIPAANAGEIHTGKAQILSTVDENGPRLYDIEITNINESGKDRNLLILVTDDTLLAKTGGIVQGMSGSPIIQEGKLVGAVTHVLVNDPTRGYGILIENMLKSAE